MYCINCGVKLADTEKECPLCKTKVYHPDFVKISAKALYPLNNKPPKVRSSKILQIMLTAIFVIISVTVLLIDLQINDSILWSGFVSGALMLIYLFWVLPSWFKNANPVIFAPCDFAAIILYLLYVNLATGGNWFLSFAFPVAGGIGIIICTLITLVRYLPKGRLYIVGGSLIAFGGFMLLTEFLLNMTFGIVKFIGWSFYPLSTLGIIGALLIFIAIYRPARELMERKFFI
ncbi:MAG: hypothetical protein IJ408_03500 [Clostridia bacterium]|nr:hypothetical protein [Clostridia bacterium]